MIKITHLTSVHPRYDIRIFVKECSYLSKNKLFEVNLIVADGKGDEKKENVNIFDVGKLNGRINRIFKTSKNIFRKAVELDSDVYHLHDPELLPIGVKLKKLKKKVIFDSHEDVPVQILSKPYLNKFFRTTISYLVSTYENYACKKFDFIVAATPHIRIKFLKINKNTLDINNFPILDEFDSFVNYKSKKNKVCYVGVISKHRGIIENIASFGFVKNNNCSLILAGLFESTALEHDCKKLKGWEKVDYRGWLDRKELSLLLQHARIGLVLLHPIINYIEAYPIKLFEYMAAGIPVIASDFPLWRKIVDDAECGLLADPMNPREIANSIDWLLEHPDEAEYMGRNGQKAIKNKYNWTKEMEKLSGIYKNLVRKNNFNL